VVTNSYDHAFAGGKRGSIIVSVHCPAGDIATMTISDNIELRTFECAPCDSGASFLMST
jgi:two-component sensor histidine kinase